MNDSAQTLTDLSYRLFEARVMPYYLHVLDKVKGAQHFDLIPSEIDAIYQDVLASLPDIWFLNSSGKLRAKRIKHRFWGYNF